MARPNKLSELLDTIESQPGDPNVSGKYKENIAHITNVLHSLNKDDLMKVIDNVSTHCDIADILKTQVPEIYSKHVLDPEMSTDVATGIGLLDGEVEMEVDGTVDLKERAMDYEYYRHVAKYTPIRLTYDERKLMRLLDSTFHVSEYTDKVDIIHDGSKSRVILREIKEVSAILSGLAVAHNYEAGQRLVKDRDYHTNAEFFRNIFEIGRRYKILNPDRMRNSYGKLIYFLMDSRKPDIQELLNFDCVAPVNTVYSFLSSKKNGLALLSDPKLKIATMEISPEGKSRSQIQHDISAKESAIKYLTNKYSVHKSNSIIVPKSSLMKLKMTLSRSCKEKKYTAYATRTFAPHSQSFHLGFSFLTRGFQSQSSDSLNTNEMTADEVQNCIYSMSDHHAHLRAFRRPCDKMIEHLSENFDPVEAIPKFSLSISAGSEGSRLSHNHSRQFTYVLQTLSLWREIAHEMFALWHFSECDLLDSHNPYRLRNTGQGLNRVQECPNVLNGMRQILRRVQQSVGTWIGSNAIHLGDHNVPNAFIFIDKYTQIPRILNPVVTCLEKIPELYKSTAPMKQYIDTQFGGPKNLKMLILTDFFRHAFDGSGADNFNDAGSCIDGRLTSAWNWCSKIEEKSYFPIFLLTGFCGFDGRFDDG